MPDVYRPPSIGRFRKRITIQQISTAAASDGGTAGTWTTFANAWASIEPTGGQKIYVGGVPVQQEADSYEIKMLYQPGINATMRAQYSGRTFNFLTVIDVGELHRDLLITAKEVTNPS